ncbi:coproporphyrinogen dehydrogenase HemZ [Hungatella hathewayi]
MIGIILDDNAYEQDIRELLMAFYPGETYIHEERDGDEMPRFSVYGTTGGNQYSLTVREYGEDGEMLENKASVEADFSNRFETKNRIKRMLYGLLSEKTKKELPWGTLTGIRPTKIAMTKLLEGKQEDEIRTYMKETYLASDAKIDLSIEIAERERKLLSAIDYERGYSLYVGIPFCPTTCLYCSFTSFPIKSWEKRMDVYLAALFKEMDYVAETMAGRTLDTVYFGGGTPTSLSAEHLERVMEKLKATFDFSEVKEFTVEAGRPDSITEDKLKVLLDYGVTRISINPQTMKQETLDLIGRRHTVDLVKEKYRLAREMGFDNINMDLIIGLPEEDLEDVRRTMEEIKALDPDSITVHSLAIKRAARLNMFKEKYGDLKITNTQEMIDLTAAYAREMGQEPYYLYRQKNMAGNFENVGYSRPGKACIYNILIMEEKQTIAACGAGTTTKVVFPRENRLERVENVKDVEQYISRIDEMLERKGKLLGKIV